jgi:hypothetical protein
MSDQEELKKKILEWFEKHSIEGTKTRFYLKDIVKAFPEYGKMDIHKAANACIDDGTLQWFSTGSTSLLVLTKYYKG